MEYLIIKEISELKCCSERYIQQICKQGKIECTSEISAKNRTKFMIPISALSEDLQARYYAKMKKDAGLAPELTRDKPEKSTKAKKQSRSFEELSADEHTRLNF